MVNDLRPDDSDSVATEGSEPLPKTVDSAGKESLAEESQPDGRGPRSERPPTPWRRFVWLTTLTTAGGGALLGLLDYLVTSARLGVTAPDQSVLLAVQCVTTVATAGAVTGALYGVWLATILRWVRVQPLPTVTNWLQATLAGIPLAAVYVWVVLEWVIPNWPRLGILARVAGVATAIVVVIGCVVLTRLVLAYFCSQALRRRSKLEWAAALLCAAGLVAAQGIDHFVLVGLYQYAHFGLGVLALACAGLLGAVTLRALEAAGRARRFRLSMAVIAGLGVCGFVALEAAGQSSPFVQRTTFTQRARRGLSRGLDHDGDGFTVTLEGGDCDDSDPAVSPIAFEVPENGIDDNCAAGDAQWPQPEKPREGPRLKVKKPSYNVVLVIFDATRADHVGAYGYSRNTTPNLDRVARDALVFKRAYAPSTKTFYSMPSLFFGRYLSNLPRDYAHPVLRNSKPYLFRVPADLPSLPDILQDAGYRTAAFTHILHPFQQGLSRGFEVGKKVGAPTRSALRTLAKWRRERFFLWLHYTYPHSPYQKHKNFDFGDRDIDRYDSEIALCDEQLGQVVRWLKKNKLYQRTILIVAADHGEEFREHGGQFHGSSLYNEVLHVPLVVRIPGGPKGKVDSIVGLTDLMPTVLDVLDLHGSAEYLDGTNLLSAMHRTESRPAYSEYLKRSGAISRAWTTDRYKLIIDAIQRRIELYDLVEDPTESFNLARQLPDVRATLQEQADLRPLAGHSRVLTETESLDFLAIDLVYLQRNGVVLQALNRFTPADAERFRESLEELARREYLDDAVRDRLNELGISTP